jgi:hypothetical protein
MTAPSLKYLVLGQLNREFLITPDQKVHPDQLGGNLLYAAEGAGLWLDEHEKLGLVARVGEDFPREWLDRIAARGYDIEGIKVLPEEVDLRFFRAYTDLRTYSDEDPVGHFARLGFSMPRLLLGYSRPKRLTNLQEVTSQSLRQSDMPKSYQEVKAAHLCSLDYISHTLIPAALRQYGTEIITLDPGRYMYKEYLEEVKSIVIGLTAFLPSEEELSELFKGQTTDLREMVEEVASWGVDIVVVKRAWQGQLLYDRNDKCCYQVPAYPSKMIDPTGAGDVFGGGFLVGLSKTGSPLQAVMYGNVAASFAVEGNGAFYTQGALPGLQKARLESIRETIREV